MLSDRDRRFLLEMDQRLESDDPRLASLMRSPMRPSSWARRGVDATIVVSVGLAAVCVFLPGPGMLGSGLVVVALAVVALVVRRRLVPRRAASPGPGASRTATP